MRTEKYKYLIRWKFLKYLSFVFATLFFAYNTESKIVTFVYFSERITLISFLANAQPQKQNKVEIKWNAK